MSLHAVTIAELQALLLRADTLGMSTRARERLRWLLYYRGHGCSVSATCKHFGLNRVTFYRLLHRFDLGNPSTLEDQSRRPIAVPSTLPPAVCVLVREYRLRSPQMGKEAIALLLQHEHGFTVSASAIGRLIAREGLFFADTPLHTRKRLEHGIDAIPVVTTTDAAPVVQPFIASVHAPVDSFFVPPVSLTLPPRLCPHPHCLRCRLARCNFRMLKRTLLLFSLIVNIAFVGFFVAIALLEQKQGEVSASLSSQAQNQLPDRDLLPFQP